MSSWQPMGTAPRDGTRILVREPGQDYGLDFARIVQAVWVPHGLYAAGGYWRAAGFERGAAQPDGWMPEPE